MSRLEKFAHIAQIVGSLSTAAALIFLIFQTYFSNKQLELQAETSNRGWSAELLATIYSDPPLPLFVREHAVKTYLQFQKGLGDRIALPGASFEKMRLGGADFTGADLAGARLIEAHLEGAIFNNASMTDANMSGAHMRSAKLHVTDLTFARLAGAELSSCEFHNATLLGTKFRATEPIGIDPAHAGPNMMVDLGTGYVYYLPAVAKGAIFKGATFDDTTEVCGMDAAGAKLAEAKGLTKYHLKKGCLITNGATTLPPHF